MPDTNGATDTPRKYALRLTRSARADIEAAWDYFAAIAGVEVADEWQEGLEKSLASLSIFPERCAVIDETNRFAPPPVRKHLYRRTRSGPTYHIFFRIHVDPADMAIVRILAVRHAARAPLTDREVREMDASAEDT